MSYTIKALNVINWIIWKERIETILNPHGVHRDIDGTSKRPTMDKDEITYWDKQDYVTQTLILNNIKDDKVVHVSHAKTIKEAWENLETIHEMRRCEIPDAEFKAILIMSLPKSWGT
ncbi:hypothetical protein BDR06DRAFT_969488 [Suillus hirtellus]|nr:hypothetical protein BDR06DRAFT_969488 [Suillus hirtellus]